MPLFPSEEWVEAWIALANSSGEFEASARARSGAVDLVIEADAEHADANVWLVNTGWTGGPFGEGERMPIQATRALLHAALSGELDRVEYRVDPVFGFDVPLEVPGVEPRLLDPRATWRNPSAYDEKAGFLARKFQENFAKFADPEGEIAKAGPRV